VADVQRTGQAASALGTSATAPSTLAGPASVTEHGFGDET